MPRGNANVTVVENPTRQRDGGEQPVVEHDGGPIRDPQGGYGYYDFNLLWQ
jgi:hypothetical protein